MDVQQLILLALKTSIVLTVFGFGLRATLDDVLYLVRRPGLLFRSLLAMFAVMTVFAVALASWFDLRASVEIALVALALSPLPPLLPRKLVKSGGHGSYAIGLVVAVSLLAIVIVPVGVHLVGRYFDQPFAMSAGTIAKAVLLTILVPLAAGLAVGAKFPAFATRLARPVSLVSKDSSPATTWAGPSTMTAPSSRCRPPAGIRRSRSPSPKRISRTNRFSAQPSFCISW
jgi:BASS family bile acid:Na+ symporter